MVTMKHSINIKGHSGCLVKVVSADGEWWVEKSALTAEYAGRLRRQIRKQREARRANRLASVIIPEIHSEQELPGGGYAVRMEYLQLRDCGEFYSTASIRGVERVAVLLLDYLEANLVQCALRPVDAAILLHKLDSIEAKLVASGRGTLYRSLLEQVREHAGKIHGLPLPMGPNHGDLTLSNVMMAGDLSCIGLFDFLDSYLESPLVDIAKVRQDTQFGWSSLMAEDPLDRVRFMQIMRHTDAIIVRHFGAHNWFRCGIDLVQAVNLLRIAPYARTESVHRFILDAITSLELNPCT